MRPQAETKKTMIRAAGLLILWLMLLLPGAAQAAITVADVTSEIPADIAVQAGASGSDLSKNVLTLSYSVTTNATGVVLTGITVNDTGSITTSDAVLKVYVNRYGKYTTRGAVLALTKTQGTWTKGTAYTFDTSVPLTQNVKAYVFIVYDLLNTAASKTTKTAMTAMTVTGDTWSGTATTANTTSIIGKTACMDYVSVSDCGKCHNFNGYYQKFYPYSSLISKVKGSHDKHGGMKKFDCYMCHNKANNYLTHYTSTATEHMNKAANVGPRIYDNVSSAASRLGNYSSVSKKCTNVDCHGGVKTPKWGTTFASCSAWGASACHGNPPSTGAHSAHFTSLQISGEAYCNYCHYGAGSGTNVHGDGNVDVNINTTIGNNLFAEKGMTAAYTPGGTRDGTCAGISCHGGVTTYQWTSGTGTSSNPSASKYIITIPSGTISGRAVPATETRAAGWLKCEACHINESGVGVGTEASGVTRWNSARSGKHNKHNTGSALPAMRSYTGQVAGVNHDRKRIRAAYCYSCHSDAHFNGTAYRWRVTAGQDNLTTYHFDANTGDTNNKLGGRINGFYIYSGYVDVSTSQQSLGTSPTQSVYYMNTASTYKGGTCSLTDCHGGGEWSYVSSLDCTTCHAKVLNGKAANVVAEFSMSSHHVQGVAVNSEHCYKCHWEADWDAGNSKYVKNSTYHRGDGTSDLVIYDVANYTGNLTGRPTTANTATLTTFKRYSTLSQSGANFHCLGCHSEAGKGKQPFGDGKNTNAYSWDGSSVWARYMSFKSYTSHRYNTTTYNVSPYKVKTSSSHYYMNKHQRGVMVNATWANDANEPAAGTYSGNNAGSTSCLDCHNSHGSNLQFGQYGFSSYSSATGKYKGAIIKQVWAGRHGYENNVPYSGYVASNYVPTEAYYVNNLGGANSGRSAIWSAQAALCFDCHLGEDTATGGVGTATTSMPRNYMQYGRNKGNIIAGYYDAINYEQASSNRNTIHGRGRWYMDNSNAGYANTTNTNSPAFWVGEFLYKKGTIIGTHFQKHPGNTVQGYTPLNWRNSTVSGNSGAFMRGMCTGCHDPHGVNSINGSPYRSGLSGANNVGNLRYYSPQLKGMHLTALYQEDRAGDRNANVGTQTYIGLNLGGTNTITNARVAPRIEPARLLANPRSLGNGYGTNSTAYGQDGFFIDDNTFGVIINNGTTAVDLFANNNANLSNMLSFWFSARGATPVFRTSAGTITVNGITENESQFAGLCLGCHPKSKLINSVSAHNNRSASFITHVHKTVKGWAATANSPNNADIVPNYYLNRLAGVAGINNAYTNANNKLFATQGSLYHGNNGLRLILDNGYMPGHPYTWGLDYAKQTNETGGTNNIQVQYHNFPCSKCHTPHSARLPRLMKTNCLDVWQSKDVANNWANSQNVWMQKHSENANNRMNRLGAPGSTTNSNNVSLWSPAIAVRCHNSPLVKDAAGQTRWNDVTPW